VFRPIVPTRIAAIVALTIAIASPTASAGEAMLLWGDTHLHSNNSFDAYLNRNATADPETAYRWAKGLPVVHPGNRARIQIQTPLDFLVVADHAEYLGVMKTIVEDGLPRENLGPWERFVAWRVERLIRGSVASGTGAVTFSSFLPETGDVREAAKEPPADFIPNSALVSQSTWQQAIRVADAHNDPGHFTALIGWEWSSIPAGANLHRVVFTSAGADVASQFHPWSSADSYYPDDLWKWLDETSARTGADFVAIPHNSNISKGYMFPETTLRGEPVSADYAKLRARWEPVAEVTQLKGDSETHPDLSPADPFADFEHYPFYIEQEPSPYRARAGDFARAALRRGLAIEAKVGTNPYRFGMIGATDAHTGIASAEEPNFWGKMATDGIPEAGPVTDPKRFRSGWSFSAQGLAGVWAEANTREAILDAFRRRAVYATTGPRIVVKVRAGFGDGPGVPMGGVLEGATGSSAPRLVIEALRDPKSANLDRIQVIKGWLDASGETHEQVHDVAWSGGREPGPDGAVPPVGNSVDPATVTYSNDIGAATLSADWRDPDFDPSQSAFYYVRVLEIPTPRHSALDAVALGMDPREMKEPFSIQERAYTSPVWYRP
jgi:hypothetical protein